MVHIPVFAYPSSDSCSGIFRNTSRAQHGSEQVKFKVLCVSFRLSWEFWVSGFIGDGQVGDSDMPTGIFGLTSGNQKGAGSAHSTSHPIIRLRESPQRKCLWGFHQGNRLLRQLELVSPDPPGFFYYQLSLSSLIFCHIPSDQSDDNATV